jgi:NADH dehydrogenase
MCSVSRTQVVVVGAGFGGLSAARALADAKVDADVTLIDRHIYSTFQPLLYQVATGGLNPGDVAYPIRSFAFRRSLRYRHGTVVAIDANGQRIALASGASLPFDYLVVAVGSRANYFGVPGAAAHSRTLYTRREAIELRDALMGEFERMAADGHSGAGLSVVIVGGGATGVEMAGTLADMRATALPVAFPEVDPAAMRVIVVEQSDALLDGFTPRLRRYARRALEERGVELRFGTSVAEVGADRVMLADGTSIPAQMTVWAAGVGVSPAVAAWGLPRGRGGRLLVEPDLRVQGHDHVFAVGDVAVESHAPLPQLAQPAIQTGRHAGRQIARLMAGQDSEPFAYRDLGVMATIGRRAAVVQLPHGIELTGTIAWLAWLGLHIVRLLGNRNRVSALVDLTARYFAWPTGAGVIVGDIPSQDVDE